MRIIAGKYRGKVLAGFCGTDIRPTSDRVKESLFQILSARLSGARVLDLFAGSGALGIEAFSRGAEEVVFNDSSRASLALLEKNLASVKERIKIYALDFRACLKAVTGTFDLVFADPPYKEQYTEELLAIIAERRLLKEDGLVILESEREESVPEGWALSDMRSYGRTKIFMLKRIAS